MPEDVEQLNPANKQILDRFTNAVNTFPQSTLFGLVELVKILDEAQLFTLSDSEVHYLAHKMNIAHKAFEIPGRFMDIEQQRNLFEGNPDWEFRQQNHGYLNSKTGEFYIDSSAINFTWESFRQRAQQIYSILNNSGQLQIFLETFDVFSKINLVKNLLLDYRDNQKGYNFKGYD